MVCNRGFMSVVKQCKHFSLASKFNIIFRKTQVLVTDDDDWYWSNNEEKQLKYWKLNLGERDEDEAF